MTKLADLQKLALALHYAADKHRHQRRKDVDRSPYINHPIALLHELTCRGDVDDVDVICAAILHEVVEDCADTKEQRLVLTDEIERLFGAPIRSIVLEVTDDKDLPKAERKQQQVEHASHLSEQAKLVKLADKIVNLQDVASSPPADWPLERRQQYFDWARRVVDAMGDQQSSLVARFAEVFDLRPAG